MPSSLMVQNGTAPGFAIIAFVMSVPEKQRFEKAFASKSIVYPTAITMGERLLDCRPVPKKSQSVPARCQENRPECGSGNSDRGPLSSGPRSVGEDLATACNRSWGQGVRFDERSYNPPSYPYCTHGWQLYGCPGASGSYSPYLHTQYCGYTGYATSDHYPTYWPPLGTNYPMGTTARPPTLLAVSPPPSSGITADSIMGPRVDPGYLIWG